MQDADPNGSHNKGSRSGKGIYVSTTDFPCITKVVSKCNRNKFLFSEHQTMQFLDYEGLQIIGSRTTLLQNYILERKGPKYWSKGYKCSAIEKSNEILKGKLWLSSTITITITITISLKY